MTRIDYVEKCRTRHEYWEQDKLELPEEHRNRKPYYVCYSYMGECDFNVPLTRKPTYISEVAQKAYEDGKKDGYVKAKTEQFLETCDSVLDQIMAEIKQVADEETKYDEKWARGLKYTLKIIDKYKTESEDKA